MNYPVSLTPKRSALIYQHLRLTEKATAKDIAGAVKSTPNAVYRDIKPLISLGIVEEISGRPIRYASTPFVQAEQLFLRAALGSFRKQFSAEKPKKVDESVPSIRFIKDRKEMRIVTEKEAEKSRNTICIITSGHRVAESTIDVYRRATHRGVKLRAIIENHPDHNKSVDIDAYRLMGAETKYLSDLGMRLYIFDDRTVVLTSYDSRYPMRAFGISFTYGPVAKQLQELYDQRWKDSEPIQL